MPVGMGCILKFCIPGLKYMVFFVMFFLNRHSKVPLLYVCVATSKIDQPNHFRYLWH